MQAAFINSSNLALSFLFSDFSQSNSSLSCVIFTCKLAFLSSFLIERFIYSFLTICQFIFSISSVSSSFLLFSIALSWAFGFIGALGVLLLLTNSLLRNGFFCIANKLVRNWVFLVGFDAMICIVN